MGMDLVPVYAGQEPSGDPAEVQLSAAEINAIGVRTAISRMSEVSGKIETVGFVGYDEHRTSHVHTRVDGWIEKLNVRAVGDPVQKGDVLFEMFSPQIGSSAGDLVRAIEAGKSQIIDAARNKLRSHGMSDRQIERIETSGIPERNIEVEAPQDGVLISLEAADGMFLQPGTRAASLTELSTVWLIVDVFERDIAKLTDNMLAEARFEHLPSRVFKGAVDYIYPELDAVTRTLPVRLQFDNSDMLLRPNMFGTVSLIPSENRMALTVPTEAIIRTGTAERVILKTGDGTFKPRLITAGLRDNFGDGGRTEVAQGLEPGEEVVASAQFLIDSESALNAGLMRMAPTDEAPARGSGELIALDFESRTAKIRHGALDSLDWPEMTSSFPIRADVSLSRLVEGQQVSFRLSRGADGLVGLIELGPDDGVAATGTGIVNGVTTDGKLSLSHEPIPELGWPAMHMDMPVAGLDTAEVPMDVPVEFDLSKSDDGMFTVIAVRAAGSQTVADTSPQTNEPNASKAASDIFVSGTIDQFDAETRMATITHGPIMEIGMPGMTMNFEVGEELEITSLPVGNEVALTFARPDGMTMVLTGVEIASPPMEVLGKINSVDSETRTANITHGPVTQIGMPGMTMDFSIDPTLDLAGLPDGKEVTLLFTQNADFSMTLAGTKPVEVTQ
ncbi:efflux RND transporter periplasmic adaptor subunit [Leisingera sp. NJS201]|uniref:efflux RND transporter periplasmic adaptor subunit n=1 Tax=Leisingera sp. NJS201 TaxID=2508306 RepID=UPI001070B5FB|nr:efflux RND transporter periplasmic adaptor subunit [Leisingera sp. NJS201]QBR36076.1 efflux RND transporter periplasmic adaptor subunit [Leisingera sp. NJS201]